MLETCSCGRFDVVGVAGFEAVLRNETSQLWQRRSLGEIVAPVPPFLSWTDTCLQPYSNGSMVAAYMKGKILS